MENLPNELLSEIFGFLHPVHDRLARLSIVCHRWNDIIQKTSSLWEHIHLNLVQLTQKEKNVVFTCLRKFNGIVKCLRVPVLDVVFGYDYWYFIRLVTLEMTNITCLDVPTFPWNLKQFVAFKSAENIKELNLYGFWDLTNIEWTQTYGQPVSLINQGHLQLLQQRCTKLEVLKLSVNMLRISEKDLLEFLNVLQLKELQISAYNSTAANIQMKRSGLKILKSLLSSHHVSIISKLELQYISIGHKELRLLLKILNSLRFLKLCFLDIYRCITGYQYLESKSLEHFELDNLPAKNIVNLKCSMPKLRRFLFGGCSSLRFLQVISSMLQELSLSLLPNLTSLHVTSTTLKLLKVSDCGSFTSKTLHKIPQVNKKIQNCTFRGQLTRDFQFSGTEASCVLTVLRLWVTDVCKVQHIAVHCPTLKSFICNHNDPDGELPSPAQETIIDLRSNYLLDCFIILPRFTSLNIKCKTMSNFLLNVASQKLAGLHCSVVRIEAEIKLTNFSAHNCIFNRVEINAEEIESIEFNKCRIKGVLKVEGGFTDVICMRNLSQVNVDMIAQCDKIRRVILQDCVSLYTFTVFPDEENLFKSSIKASTCPSIVHGNCNDQEAESEGASSDEENLVSTISTSNCPCFSGFLMSQTMKYEVRGRAPSLSDKASCNGNPYPGNCIEMEDVNLVLNCGENVDVLNRGVSSGIFNTGYNDRNADHEHSTLSGETLHGFNQETYEQLRDPFQDSGKFQPLTGQGDEAHTRQTSFDDTIMAIDEQSKSNL